MSERWRDYVRKQMRGTQMELAERSGVNAATLSRWLSGQVAPSHEQVITFARGIGENPIQALVMAGYVSPEEARTTVKDVRIEDVDDVVLLDVLRDRAMRRAQRRR